MIDRNRIRIGNQAAAAITAAVLAFLVFLFRYPILPPGVWEDVAAGAGLRPPTDVLNGFVRGVYALIFAQLSDHATALFTIRALGWVSAALIALLVYRILRLSHPYVLQFSDDPRGALPTRCGLAACCLLFLCNDVIWSSVQALSATGLRLTVLLAAIWMTLVYIRSRRMRFATIAMFLFCLLTGETALGYLGALWVMFVALAPQRDGKDPTQKNQLALIVLRRVLVIEFFVSIAVVLTLEAVLFNAQDGVYSGESGMTDFISSYIGGMLSSIWNAASWKRWTLGFATIVAPFLLLLKLYPQDFDKDNFLTTHRAIAYACIGIVAWTQACCIDSLSFRFWLFDRSALSPLLFAVLTLLSVIMLLWIALLIGCRLYFNSARELSDFYYEDDRRTAIGEKAVRLMSRLEAWAKPGCLVLAAVTVLIPPVLRYEGTQRRMMALIGEYLEESVRECEGIDRVVTDGALDAGLELAAFREDRELLAFSMTAGLKPRDVALRQRGITAADDFESLKAGFPNTLRSWIENGSPRLDTLGTQLALNAWRKLPRKDRPTVYGVIAKPQKNFDELISTQNWGRDFAQRIIDLYSESAPSKIADGRLFEIFLFMQFRVARFCQWRAEAAGAREWGKNSTIEQALADKLDELNPSYQNAKRMLAQANGRQNVTLTPRENLQLCLRNADFDAAVPFAELVFKANPDDPEANWAIGMHHFQQRNFVHAEPFLANCLKARPDDPAVLNNLAIAEREIGRLDAAERHIREGLERLPDSPHLHRTLDSILKAKGEK